MTEPPEHDHENPSGAGRSRGFESTMLLTDAQAAMASAMDAKLSRIGITIDDLRALTAIGSVGIDRAVLANRLRSPRSQTIRRVRPLEKLGWVQCTEEGHFQLTHSGRSLVDDAISLTDDAAEKWLLERLPPEQIAQLRTLLIPVVEPL